MRTAVCDQCGMLSNQRGHERCVASFGGEQCVGTMCELSDRALGSLLAAHRQSQERNVTHEHDAYGRVACDKEIDRLRGENAALKSGTLHQGLRDKLIKLQEENARLHNSYNANLGELRGLERENAKLRGELNALSKELEIVRCGSDMNAVEKRDAEAECQRLRMELADVKGQLQHAVKTATTLRDAWLEASNEVEFCKQELKRLDPRLARARWDR